MGDWISTARYIDINDPPDGGDMEGRKIHD
jgi:hypothetical protein